MPQRPRRNSARLDPTINTGKLPDELIAFLRVPSLSLEFFENWNDGDKMVDLPVHRIYLKWPGRRIYSTLNLTLMTKTELDTMRQFFNYCFDQAEATVMELDRRAEEALKRGDDVYQRVYRRLPEFVVRERKLGPYGKSLSGRPDGVSGGNSDVDDSDNERVGLSDRDVPDEQPEPVVAANDEAEGFSFPSIWEAPGATLAASVPDPDATPSDPAPDPRGD